MRLYKVKFNYGREDTLIQAYIKIRDDNNENKESWVALFFKLYPLKRFTKNSLISRFIIAGFLASSIESPEIISKLSETVFLQDIKITKEELYRMIPRFNYEALANRMHNVSDILEIY